MQEWQKHVNPRPCCYFNLYKEQRFLFNKNYSNFAKCWINPKHFSKNFKNSQVGNLFQIWSHWKHATVPNLVTLNAYNGSKNLSHLSLPPFTSALILVKYESSLLRFFRICNLSRNFHWLKLIFSKHANTIIGNM